MSGAADPQPAAAVSADSGAALWREAVVGVGIAVAIAVYTLHLAPERYAGMPVLPDADRRAALYFLSVRGALSIGLFLVPAALAALRDVREGLAVETVLLVGILCAMKVDIWSWSLLNRQDLWLLAPIPWAWHWRPVFFLDLGLRVLVALGVAWSVRHLFRAAGRRYRARRRS